MAAGFRDFLKIGPVNIPQAYLVALIERWFSETNTLHWPCCEIGPTPVDWTMITGLRFKGQCIKLNHKYERDRTFKLLGVGPAAITKGKIRLSSITPTLDDVKVAPENDESKSIIFRRLFLYILGSCFFSNNRSVINYELVQFMENVEEAGCYNWGSITYAAFPAGMRRKVPGEVGAFTSFWPLFLFWAFEYLKILHPSTAVEDVFPRAMYWSSSCILASANLADIVVARFQLDFMDETPITWQPYVASPQLNSPDLVQPIDLAKRRVPFESVDTWEYDRIVDISRLLGGVAMGSRVLEHWLAAHSPHMMLISRSEYESVIEARDAAIAECQMLCYELARSKDNS